MDTPERNRCSTSTPISKFEDSPVFSYLNSLSPIKPVKSLHTFNSLSFAAIPSVFTSPHVKEVKISKRHPSSDHCRSENCPDNENKLGVSEGPEAFTTSPHFSRDHSAAPRESFDQGSSLGETAFEQHNEPPELEIELSWSKQMDCSSFDAPVCVPTPCNSIGTDVVPQMTDPSASFAPTLQNAPDKGSLQSQLQLQDMFRTDLHWKETENDWNSLISEAAELLIFNSPETHQGLLQKTSGPSTSVAYLPNQCVFPGSYSGQQEIEDPSSWPSGLDPIQDSMVNTSPSKFMTNHQKMVIEAGKCMPFTLKPISNLHRGTRRRCLVFDVTGAHIKNINNGSDTGSSDLSQYNQNIASTTHKELVPVTSGCILPGIGLHLNSLPTTSKDHRTAKPNVMSTGSQVMSVPLFSRSFPSLLIEKEPSDNALALTSFGRDKDPTENAFHAAEDISQASGRAMSEQSNPTSPKKKRRRLDHATETEACRRCNCKKSKCLKLYCECFAAGVYCVEPCSCQDCFNKPFHEDTVLATRKQIESRNPLAFAPKVIRNSDSIAEIGDEPSKTPASARHKRGCNCKKSSCLKKYCECYQGGVGCSISCRCEGCKNAFGRKDGPATLEGEAEPEETETEAAEKCAVDQCLQKDTIQNKEEQKSDYPPLVAPLQTYRSTSSSLQLALSKRIPLRSSYAIGTTSVFHSSECVGKQNFLQPQPKFEKQFQSAVDDEMPDILRGNNSSPGSGIKVASPNGKRVSPPQCDLGSSPSRRAVRKLLLQSIPSFPSLTQ